jgi:hypothetical protein
VRSAALPVRFCRPHQSSDPQVLLHSLQRSRRRTAVLATPDATWGHWFVKYWLGFTGQRAAR